MIIDSNDNDNDRSATEVSQLLFVRPSTTILLRRVVDDQWSSVSDHINTITSRITGRYGRRQRRRPRRVNSLHRRQLEHCVLDSESCF